jgi:hypothetical protein
LLGNRRFVYSNNKRAVIVRRRYIAAASQAKGYAAWMPEVNTSNLNYQWTCPITGYYDMFAVGGGSGGRSANVLSSSAGGSGASTVVYKTCGNVDGLPTSGNKKYYKNGAGIFLEAGTILFISIGQGGQSNSDGSDTIIRTGSASGPIICQAAGGKASTGGMAYGGNGGTGGGAYQGEIGGSDGEDGGGAPGIGGTGQHTTTRAFAEKDTWFKECHQTGLNGGITLLTSIILSRPFAGGGGGGKDSLSSKPMTGGEYGGADGRGAAGPCNDGENGWGGGGGGSHNDLNPGGKGGSGAFIIRYGFAA